MTVARPPESKSADVLALNSLLPAIVAMVVIVAASHWLVQFPINDWLTWGAFTYPFSFLVTDLTNRRFGPAAARRVIYAGFAVGVVASAAIVQEARIPIASGTAFLIAQLLDVT